MVILGLIQAHSISVAIVPRVLKPSPGLLAMHTISACLIGGILWIRFRRFSKGRRDQMIVVLTCMRLGGNTMSATAIDPKRTLNVCAHSVDPVALRAGDHAQIDVRNVT